MDILAVIFQFFLFESAQSRQGEIFVPGELQDFLSERVIRKFWEAT